MEPERYEGKDIETRKELFEYEMTEVLLRLKGEFASYNGRGTKFEELMLDDEQLEISPIDVNNIKEVGGEPQKALVAVPLDKLSVKMEMSSTAPIDSTKAIHDRMNGYVTEIGDKTAGISKHIIETSFDAFMVLDGKVINIPKVMTIPGQMEETLDSETKVPVPVHVPKAPAVSDISGDEILSDLKERFKTIDVPKMSEGFDDSKAVFSEEIKIEMPWIVIPSAIKQPLCEVNEISGIKPESVKVILPEIPRGSVDILTADWEKKETDVRIPEIHIEKLSQHMETETIKEMKKPAKHLISMPEIPSFAESAAKIRFAEIEKPGFISPNSIPIPEKPDVKADIAAVLQTLKD